MITLATVAIVAKFIYAIGFILVFCVGMVDDFKHPTKYKTPAPVVSVLAAIFWPALALLVMFLTQRAKWSKVAA